MSRKIKGVTCGVRKNLICNETICTKISCTMFIHFFVFLLQPKFVVEHGKYMLCVNLKNLWLQC